MTVVFLLIKFDLNNFNNVVFINSTFHFTVPVLVQQCLVITVDSDSKLIWPMYELKSGVKSGRSPSGG